MTSHAGAAADLPSQGSPFIHGFGGTGEARVRKSVCLHGIVFHWYGAAWRHTFWRPCYLSTNFLKECWDHFNGTISPFEGRISVLPLDQSGNPRMPAHDLLFIIQFAAKIATCISAERHVTRCVPMLLAVVRKSRQHSNGGFLLHSFIRAFSW